MKSRICILPVIILAMMALASCGVGNASSRNEISGALGVDVSQGIEIENKDSHGGFHGDGMKFTALNFSDDTFLVQIANSNEWNDMPLSDNLTALVYGIAFETDDVFTQIGPYLTDENRKSIIPEIQNGYYYFLDRHSASVDSHDDSEVFNRSSYNFTIAIYDVDADILYYVEFDT